MKIIKELKKRKTPIVRIDESLNPFDNVILFPEKLKRANELLERVGLPSGWGPKR